MGWLCAYLRGRGSRHHVDAGLIRGSSKRSVGRRSPTRTCLRPPHYTSNGVAVALVQPVSPSARSRRPLHLRNARAICCQAALPHAYRSRARGREQGRDIDRFSLSGLRAHFLKVRDVGSRLSLGLKVTADDGFTSGLRPLNCERSVRLPDDAIGCFHNISMASLARHGQRLKSLEKSNGSSGESVGGVPPARLRPSMPSCSSPSRTRRCRAAPRLFLGICGWSAAGNARNLHAVAGASVGVPLRSCGATFVAMMQTAHLRERDDLACRGKLYAARMRTILVE